MSARKQRATICRACWERAGVCSQDPSAILHLKEIPSAMGGPGGLREQSPILSRQDIATALRELHSDTGSPGSVRIISHSHN